MKTLIRAAGAALLALSASIHAATAAVALRPEVGKPLKAAQELLQQKKYKEAMGEVETASKVPDSTPYERYIIARMRGVAAAGAGDSATAVAAFEAALASGQMPPADRAATWQGIAGIAYGGHNYAKVAEAVQQYRAAGGGDAATLALLPQSLYLQGRYADAAKEMSALAAAQTGTGRKPEEAQLQFLASCASKQNDVGGYVAALTQLVTYYPKDSYWQDLILRAAAKPGFSDRLRLDVYRLRRHTNTLDSADDFIEATELALQAGMTGEAQRFLDQGYRQGVLGKGAAGEVDRQNRLKALVARNVAQDRAGLAAAAQQAAVQPGGDALLNTGLDYIGFGEYDKGLPLMQQGLARGGLKNADAARLRYGAALLQAGRREEAAKTLGGVRGSDGAADLARLWAIRAASS